MRVARAESVSWVMVGCKPLVIIAYRLQARSGSSRFHWWGRIRGLWGEW